MIEREPLAVHTSRFDFVTTSNHPVPISDSLISLPRSTLFVSIGVLVDVAEGHGIVQIVIAQDGDEALSQVVVAQSGEQFTLQAQTIGEHAFVRVMADGDNTFRLRAAMSVIAAVPEPSAVDKLAKIGEACEPEE